MSDYDDRDGGKVGSFFLGFLLGVIVCVAGGGALMLVQNDRQMAAEADARDRAVMSMEEARKAEEEARLSRELADKATKEAAEKPSN